ncbi:MAG: SDR family oxidoreductase, partial [Solirubrobacteraceae bacterium]
VAPSRSTSSAARRSVASGSPTDIAEAVVWLLSEARWLTGQVIYVDGGFMAAGLPYLEGLERPRVAT